MLILPQGKVCVLGLGLKRSELSDQIVIVIDRATAIAHDSNNHICCAMLANELILRRTPPDSEAQSFLASQMLSLNHLARMMKKLMAFNVDYQIRTELVNVNALLVDDQIALQLAIGSHVQLVLELHEIVSSTPVLVDPSLLSEAILNLATNARAAMVESPLRELRIETAIKDGWILIMVSDTGCGMSDEEQAKLSKGEPFTTKVGHTGLGMGLVRRSIERMNGKISIDTGVNAGTTVIISLPPAN